MSKQAFSWAVSLCGSLALLGIALAFPGCQPRTQPRIALVMKSLANEFFLTMERGARAHQAAQPDRYALLANGIKDELDVGRQIDLVEQMIAQRVDAIVLAPADSRALAGVCQKALAAGIVVVNIDNRLDAAALAEKGIRIPFVGPDNRKGARRVGEYLARRLAPGSEVAVVEGAPNAFNATQRRLGFEEAMQAAGMRIVSSQSGYWETGKSDQIVAALLTEHPRLRAVLCANDSMALGVVAALRASDKLRQVLVVGYDNITAVRPLLAEGKMLATADQHADRLAVLGIQHTLDLLAGKTVPDELETPVELVTAQPPPEGR